MTTSPSKIIIIGIDPGPKESGVAIMVLPELSLESFVSANAPVEQYLATGHKTPAPVVVAIEMVANYGMAVGESTFRTCVQIGRFEKACEQVLVEEVYRGEVKTILCGDKKAKQTNIIQQITDMFGGKEKAIGAVKCSRCKGKGWFGAGRPECTACRGTGWKYPPGPLAAVKSHAWSALAIALAYAIKKGHLSPLAVNPGALDKSSPPSTRDAHLKSGTGLTTPQETSS